MNIDPNQLNLINLLIADSYFQPFRCTAMSGKENEINKFWQDKIFENSKKSPAYLIQEMSGSSMDGFILINELDWDSKIFDLKMAAINEFVLNRQSSKKGWIADQLLEKTVIKAKEVGYQFLLCKTYTDDIYSIHALEKAGFLLVDTLLDYHVDFRKVNFNKIPIPEVADEILIRFANEDDGEELAALARAAFANHFGRYHSDPRIQKELATQTYVEWMQSSLHGYADYFVLAEINHRIAGLSIWKKTSELEKDLPIRLGHYSIGAIHPDFYGRKLFSILTYEGMKLLQPEVDLIEGPTHINNYAVQRGYNRLGWQIGDARHSFHKWLD
jgi:hypothetical protein